MQRFQSLVVLPVLFAFAAPAWSAGDAAKVRRAPATTQAQPQILKAPAGLDPAVAEKAPPRRPSAGLSTASRKKLMRHLGPDLTVEAFPPQGSTSMRFFIRNQGGSDANAFQVSFLCSYFPYSNGLADPGLTQPCEIPLITVSGVQAGAVDTRQIPASALPGGPVHVSVTVKVDSADQVDETVETNNSDSTSWH